MRFILMVIACLAAHSDPTADALAQTASSNTIEVSPTLDLRIGRAEPKQYRAVLDGRDWQNPWLDATNNGFWLRAGSTPQEQFVTLADLRRALARLPISDWPYGRVIVIQSPSLAGADPDWWTATEANVKAAREVAAALDADWWGWPP